MNFASPAIQRRFFARIVVAPESSGTAAARPAMIVLSGSEPSPELAIPAIESKTQTAQGIRRIARLGIARKNRQKLVTSAEVAAHRESGQNRSMMCWTNQAKPVASDSQIAAA